LFVDRPSCPNRPVVLVTGPPTWSSNPERSAGPPRTRLGGETVDLNKLTQSEKIIAGSAIAFIVFSFLPWYGKGSYNRSGWSYFLFGIIPFLLAVVMVAQIAISRFTDTKLPDPPLPWGQIHLILGGLTALLVFLKLIIGDKYHVGITGLGGLSVDLDRKFGLFLAFLASLGLVAGGYLKSREPAESTPPPVI
jgi:hypothetical protein